MSKAERLSDALDEFLNVSPDVEAAAIVSADGLPIASALPVDVQEDRLAAMSAALLTLGEKAAEGLGKGDLAQVFVEGEYGYVVLMAAGPHAVLVCVTSKESKVGLVLYEMRKAAAQILEIMDAPASSFGSVLPSVEALGAGGESNHEGTAEPALSSPPVETAGVRDEFVQEEPPAEPEPVHAELTAPAPVRPVDEYIPAAVADLVPPTAEPVGDPPPPANEESVPSWH